MKHISLIIIGNKQVDLSKYLMIIIIISCPITTPASYLFPEISNKEKKNNFELC